jgi:hypothetical protein
MRAGYRAFLMGTATDLPTRGFSLTPAKSEAIELVANLRKWNKGISLTEH